MLDFSDPFVNSCSKDMELTIRQELTIQLLATIIFHHLLIFIAFQNLQLVSPALNHEFDSFQRD